ncbi:chitin-binding protein [Streptomyces sp. A7024]|uniref:Chitin-binding protein n=1 Tax=Streptomyces coryli TaxID=1128680 RepID=A0A6G4U889_9ACTN|nr:lytic polysaccharide monooxygenase [Streptomyces coryli]NGN68404.1 chitin-binding protein [Streptomyces coryli]
MTARTKRLTKRVAALTAATAAPIAFGTLAATPAAAHGSMEDPISRVYGCYAEGPESPQSAACKAAVAKSGAQAFYDWNGVRDGEAGGQSKEKIPDGKLCSGGDEAFAGLDLPRADWPATKMTAGAHTFKYKGTAPHVGTFDLYITKESYDPSKPLKWSDLEDKPFTSVKDPKLTNGSYVFDGKIPERSGRHLIYAIWQRSDSPEAFYSCSDVVFGKDSGAAAPAAPSEEKVEEDADKSTVDHSEHDAQGGHEAHESPEAASTSAPAANAPEAKGGAKPASSQANLAETGGNSESSAAPYALGGAAALAVGAAALFNSMRKRTMGGRHRA